MAKRRMNENKRLFLRKKAKEFVTEQLSSKKQKLDAMIEHCAGMINVCIREQFPQAHMDILRRYDLLQSPSGWGEIKVLAREGGQDVFDYFPTSRHKYQDCGDGKGLWEPIPKDVSRYIKITDSLFQELVNVREDSNDYQKEFSEACQDFYTLIDASKYFEEIVAVWSGSEEFEEELFKVGTEISPINDEIKQRIRSYT